MNSGLIQKFNWLPKYMFKIIKREKYLSLHFYFKKWFKSSCAFYAVTGLQNLHSEKLYLNYSKYFCSLKAITSTCSAVRPVLIEHNMRNQLAEFPYHLGGFLRYSKHICVPGKFDEDSVWFPPPSGLCIRRDRDVKLIRCFFLISARK